MPDYTDPSGIHYRPAGRCPYSELPPGTRFALDGDPRVYVREETSASVLAPPGGLLARLLPAVRHGTVVIVLERVDAD